MMGAVLLLVLLGQWRVRRLQRQRLALQQQLQEREALLDRATRDALTRLWNRAAIVDILGRELQSASLNHAPLAVALIDIDQFKRINDTHGHPSLPLERLCRSFSELRCTHQRVPIAVTASLGVTWPRSQDSLETLIARADAALYAAKADGRNRVEYYDTERLSPTASLRFTA